MTSNLPFGLKVKPARHYFNGGSIYFAVSKGKLYYIITNTTKASKTRLYELEVTSKEHLDQLLKVKSFSELQRLTEVAV